MANDQGVKVKGKVITLNETEYVLPPIPLVHMSEIARVFEGGNVQDAEYTEAMAKAVFHSLARNYKDMDLDDVREAIDATNFEDILKAFMTVNKLVGGGSSTGEAAAG